MIHHRTPEFSAELAVMLELLPPLFGTREPVLPIHATGRGALEAAIVNLFSADDEIAVCCNGRFGGLWARIAESQGLVVHRIAADWGHDVDPGEVEQAISEHPKVRAVALPHSDPIFRRLRSCCRRRWRPAGSRSSSMRWHAR